MKPLTNPKKERARVHHDVLALIQEARQFVASDPRTYSKGLGKLFELPKAVYEHLNQLQHEGLLLDAIAWFIAEGIVRSNVTWLWHPRQTSGKGEPDLKAVLNGTTVVCAEATAAAAPKGTTRKRLEAELERCPSDCQAGNYYCFVRTVEMERTASGIVKTRKLQVTVKCLPFK